MFKIVKWPDSQDLMFEPGFEEHAHPVLDNKGVELYGSGAFFVDEDWIEERERINQLFAEYINILCIYNKVTINKEEVKEFKTYCESINLEIKEKINNSKVTITLQS